MVFETGEA